MSAAELRARIVAVAHLCGPPFARQSLDEQLNLPLDQFLQLALSGCRLFPESSSLFSMFSP